MNGEGKEMDSLWSGKSTEKVTERENSKLAKWVKEIGGDWRRLNIYNNEQLATDHNPWLWRGGSRKVHYWGNWGDSTVFLSHVSFSAYGRCIVVMEVNVLALRRSGVSLGIRNGIKCPWSNPQMVYHKNTHE